MTSFLATMPKARNILIERLEKFVQTGQFEDVNLNALRWKAETEEGITMSVFSVPDLKRMQDALKGVYRPAKVGESFGPTWSTHWFKLSIYIPPSLKGETVHLLFDSSCEALVWDTTGSPLKGLTGGNVNERHVDYRLTKSATGKEHIELLMEIGCNGLFGAGSGGNGSIFPPENDRYYKLETVKLVVENKAASELRRDFEILIGLVREFSSESQLASDALYAANKIVDSFRYDIPETVKECRKLALDFYKTHERALGHTGLHQVTAIGNCHIDTAWLWPYDETKRKAARSWATQIGFMDDYPGYTFAASQAQQFEWVETLYPKLFSRIKDKAKAGSFVPIGGTWVEMDCNLPSGEGLVRQFLYGQRYFESRFGERCSVFWLPDTFGYSSQLPQIVKEADMKYFFTQKLSWNNINKFPHTTFWWHGLDGSRILTHFSPADSYVAGCTVRDINLAVTNNKDKEYSHKSLLVYGHGDGGGGPLQGHMERLQRMSNLEGLPASVKMGSPNTFYEELEATSKDVVAWRGELYFELHRGTYTSHSAIKKGNRKGELLLRLVEILSTLASVKDAYFKNPKTELDRLWKLLLLNQFHDVLPGSSIEIAYEDPLKFYKDIQSSGADLAGKAWKSLQTSLSPANGSEKGLIVFNPTSWTRTTEVVEVDITGLDAKEIKGANFQQLSADGTSGLVLVDSVPGMAIKTFAFGNKPSNFVPIQVLSSSETISFEPMDDYLLVNATEKGDIVVQNAFARSTFDCKGRLISLFDRREAREVILSGHAGNVFKYFEDIPLFWDAWDVEIYHLQKGWDAEMGTLVIEECGPLRVVLRGEHPISKTSKLTQRIILSAVSPVIEFDTKISWNENRRILKVEFPVNIINDNATYETQFGVVQRPTHYNTSWDAAKFEVCGHKFVDYSEYGYGVTLLNDCKYGFSVHGNVMRMSILRSPKAPDAHCDIGDHHFRYALAPHKGSFAESSAVQQGYEFNVPLVISYVRNNCFEARTYSADRKIDIDPSATSAAHQFFDIDKSNVVIDTVKIAEDPIGLDIVVRMYEAHGGRGVAKLVTTIPIVKAHYCNILEDEGSPVEFDANGAILVPYSPFKIVSLKLKVASKK